MRVYTSSDRKYKNWVRGIPVSKGYNFVANKTLKQGHDDSLTVKLMSLVTVRKGVMIRETSGLWQGSGP